VSRERNNWLLRRSSISLALTSTIISARAQAARRGNGSPWLQGPLHAAQEVRRVDLTSLERVEVRKRFLDVTTGQTLFDSRAENPRALSPGRRLT